MKRGQRGGGAWGRSATLPWLGPNAGKCRQWRRGLDFNTAERILQQNERDVSGVVGNLRSIRSRHMSAVKPTTEPTQGLKTGRPLTIVSIFISCSLQERVAFITKRHSSEHDSINHIPALDIFLQIWICLFLRICESCEHCLFSIACGLDDRVVLGMADDFSVLGVFYALSYLGRHLLRYRGLLRPRLLFYVLDVFYVVY